MIRPTTSSRESQQTRLESKIQGTQLMNRAVDGQLIPAHQETIVNRIEGCSMRLNYENTKE